MKLNFYIQDTTKESILSHIATISWSFLYIILLVMFFISDNRFVSSRQLKPENPEITAQNRQKMQLNEIHIQLCSDHRVKTENLRFSKEFTLKEKSDTFLYNIYNLSKPLNPGDTISMFFTNNFYFS